MNCSKICKLFVVLAMFAATLSLAVSTARADDVLRYRVTCNTSSGRLYSYWRFSTASRTLVSGDYIEYDVYVHHYATGTGGIEIINTDGTYFRDQAGWVDQNGVSGHPAADLRSVAYGKWYHRRLAVPSSMVGKTIARWDVAVDGTYGFYEICSAMYNNVCITNGGSTVLSVYTDGNPGVNTLDFNTAATVQSAQLIPTSPRRGPVQVAAHLFYWYDAPSNNADGSQMVFDPHGLAGDAWSGYGSSGYYSSQNEDWWEGVFEDLKYTGTDIASLICWGNHPGMPYFRMSALSNYMVPALERSGADIKIALFDDTTSECCEWNYNNGRGYNANTQMPLSDSNNWSYFYDLKIKPFFQAVPMKHWATHNGATVENGGRPIIITYASGWFSGVGTYGASCWQAIKEAFARDFKDANGNGITPFVIHEKSWIDSGAGSTADSYYTWGAALNGPTVNSLNSYYTGAIGPGYDDQIIRSPGSYHDRARGSWLTSWYNGTYSNRKLWDCNLLIMETWNELWEGTGIERCTNYPDPWGGYLPDTFYMDTWANNIITSIGLEDLDATFLRTWGMPTTLTRGSTSITTNVRNDGLLPWNPASNLVECGVWLEDSSGNEISGSERRITLPSTILSGQSASMAWTCPADWPTGSYNMRFDMVWNAWTWFEWQGDTPAKIAVTIN